MMTDIKNKITLKEVMHKRENFDIMKKRGSKSN